MFVVVVGFPDVKTARSYWREHQREFENPDFAGAWLRRATAFEENQAQVERVAVLDPQGNAVA